MKKTIKQSYVCPDCGSTETVGAGKYLTKQRGWRPRRKCKKCATTFYVPERVKQEASK